MRFAKAVVKHRILILILTVALLVPSAFGMAATRVNYDMLTYLPEDMDTVVGQNELLEDFNKGAFTFLIFEDMPNKDVAALKQQVEQVDHVDTVLWYDSLADLSIPMEMLPQVRDSSAVYGTVNLQGVEVPIAGIAGDQQAALFGQMCVEPGSVKNTYGTGCFLLMNSGEKPIVSKNNLLTTIAWKIGDKVSYALEGSIFVGGSVVQWLRDGLGIIRSSSEVEELAASVPDTGGVYFVPALTGLAAPHWDQYARGAISGISRGTTAAHIARAALEGIAYQTLDIVNAMQRDAGVSLVELKVDGGAARNNLLMQFQADLLATKVIRPRVTETTALGAAYLAGLAVGYWESIGEIRKQWQAEHIFEPAADRTQIAKAVAGWEDAVRRVLHDRNE